MKMMRKLSVLVMAVMMLSCVALVAYADEEPTTGNLYKYGVFEPTETELYDSGRVKVLCPEVHVTNTATAKIVFTSKNYTQAKIGDTVYLPVVDEEAKTSTFTLPVNLNAPTSFTATTVAMGGEPKDIDYTVTIAVDQENPKAITNKTYKDGFYTTTVNTKKATYGWKVSKGNTQLGFSYPSKDYELPVTIQIKDGKIVDVAYTHDPKEVMVNTSSDFNYLLWAMNGHLVNDHNYDYLAVDGNYQTYHLNPIPAKCGTGMKDQIIEKNGITGVDTVTAATITSRAIIDSVDQSLMKAEAGEKDDPDPVLPTPDTSDDIIPADGTYKAKATTVGFDMSADKDILLEVKDGKMTAKLMYIEQKPTSYPHIYAGTEAEALAAGEEKWYVPENYDYGYRSKSGAVNYGSLYRDIPIKSLDKPNHFVMFADGSGNWFNRLITISSKDIEALSDEEVALMNADAALEAALANPEATADDLNKAKNAYKEAIAGMETKKDEASQAEVKEAKAEVAVAQKKIAELTVKAAQVKGVKAKKGKKKATVSWKKLGAGYKYEVFVSTKVNKGFKKKATSAKLKAVVKKLKSKKTYYVKVRAFKNVNGKKVYTGYSDIASVKVK